MAKLFIENPPKIYLKDSDKVRLADYRARIVRESSPRSPEDNEDLVFLRVSNKCSIPKNAIYVWQLNPNGSWYYTTEARCKQMVSPDKKYWTKKKLDYFKEVEARLWRDWWDGHVYGYIVEKWDAKRREWMTTSSLWGMYGAKDLLENLATETDGVSIPICIDDEDMKYDFDNVEKKVNEFK